MQKVTPCLWFDGQAEQAAGYYVSLLPDQFRKRWTLLTRVFFFSESAVSEQEPLKPSLTCRVNHYRGTRIAGFRNLAARSKCLIRATLLYEREVLQCAAGSASR
jgi:hypothetical protein